MKIDKKMQDLAASLALCLTAGMFPVAAGADVPRTTQHYTNELCVREGSASGRKSSSVMDLLKVLTSIPGRTVLLHCNTFNMCLSQFF